jgi:hypothetical protein
MSSGFHLPYGMPWQATSVAGSETVVEALIAMSALIRGRSLSQSDRNPWILEESGFVAELSRPRRCAIFPFLYGVGGILQTLLHSFFFLI